MNKKEIKCVNKGTVLMVKFVKYVGRQKPTEQELEHIVEAMREIQDFTIKLEKLGE